MSLTHLRQQHDVATQEVAPFTGEGAYHGSTRRRATTAAAPQAARPAPPVVEEMRPATYEAMRAQGRREIARFDATFTNAYAVKEVLEVPSQEAIRDDGVTLCWCPIDEAARVAGPLTRRVIEAMRGHLVGDKKYVYVDSKVQYFEAGDVPVDSEHWHVDGSIVARGELVDALGHNLLHDMRARLEREAISPRYLAYQSSTHCATRFLDRPLTLSIPELIPSFDELDAAVRALAPPEVVQPPASIVATDGCSLHRAAAATGAGWRLWVRIVETDREVNLTSEIIRCYGTVFRHGLSA